ncbi:MAG: NADH:ubiquinone oxidoreductase [Rhodobacteraceae bacterium]|nr:NADH:ubiquinone oxidoreductase [Paracoccaceae bacterium]MCW9044300.1 NADH:ubiquinone oxidoreductase [Pseudopelagicola sp.]
MICWGLGIVGGLIAFFLLNGGMATLLVLILAVVVAVCLGFILIKAFCAKDEAAAVAPPMTPAARTPAAAPETGADAKGAAPKAAEPEAAPVAEVEEAPVPEAAAEPAPAAAPVEVPAAAVSTGPDDLKKLKGVGPKIEEKLHAAGVTRFAQIATWGADDIAKMDELLSFRGRIERDGWVEQAKTLAAGGETEFAKRVADGDVY